MAKRVSGKEKGSSFERWAAAQLDKWWKVPAKTFWRTTNSGGWVEPGDIAPRLRQGATPVIFPFVIECKFYKQINLFNNRQKKPLINIWWKQVTESQQQAIKASNNTYFPIRLLIMKENNSPCLIAFSLDDSNRPDYTDYIQNFLNNHTHFFYRLNDKSSIYILPFNMFINNIEKQTILNLLGYI